MKLNEIQKIIMKKFQEEKNGIYNEETAKKFQECEEKYPILVFGLKRELFKQNT